MRTQDVIIRPVISEQSIKDAASQHYTFIVAKGATKTDIKEAVKVLFNVDAVGIRTNMVKGVRVRYTRAHKSTTDESYKKARVKLKGDQKIDIFEEVKE
jgi:large subunit ribosomal protein L23